MSSHVNEDGLVAHNPLDRDNTHDSTTLDERQSFIKTIEGKRTQQVIFITPDKDQCRTLKVSEYEQYQPHVSEIVSMGWCTRKDFPWVERHDFKDPVTHHRIYIDYVIKRIELTSFPTDRPYKINLNGHSVLTNIIDNGVAVFDFDKQNSQSLEIWKEITKSPKGMIDAKNVDHVSILFPQPLPMEFWDNLNRRVITTIDENDNRKEIEIRPDGHIRFLTNITDMIHIKMPRLRNRDIEAYVNIGSEIVWSGIIYKEADLLVLRLQDTDPPTYPMTLPHTLNVTNIRNFSINFRLQSSDHAVFEIQPFYYEKLNGCRDFYIEFMNQCGAWLSDKDEESGRRPYFIP